MTNTNEPTQKQTEETTKEFSKVAGEAVRAEFSGSFLFVFGSEIACLRIYYANRFNKTARVNHTAEYGWYYTHETMF
jgi:hypothetical protein